MGTRRTPAQRQAAGRGRIDRAVQSNRLEFGPDFFRYGGIPPADYVEGCIWSFPLPAGQAVGLVCEILPAEEIVWRIAAEAHEAIERHLTSPLQ
jgi:hypothetical protein